MDVKFLYTVIPHEDGLKALKFLDQRAEKILYFIAFARTGTRIQQFLVWR